MTNEDIRYVGAAESDSTPSMKKKRLASGLCVAPHLPGRSTLSVPIGIATDDCKALLERARVWVPK